MTPTLSTLSAFVRARFAMTRLRTRGQLEAYQRRKLVHFLRRRVPQVAAFAGAELSGLGEAPIMDKAQLMSAFERYNTLGLGANEGWDIFGGRQAAPHGYSLGASTGTSGNRGLYVVSDAERYEWLGVILSRAFPDLLTRREKVAVILPQASALYDAANESGRLQLKFFDLAGGVEAQVAAVEAFSPSVIVAPPRVLVALAEADTELAPREVFSGAEVLEATDRATIEARFGGPVREIYMATEGLFAVACRHGALHLIEDRVAFEWEPVGRDGLVTPLVTDFTRRTQIMLRYRMNDLVRLGEGACACGSPHRIIEEIIGRQGDAFVFKKADGGQVTLTPDVIRNAVLDADRAITDYRVTQTGVDAVLIELPVGQEGQLGAAKAGLRGLLSGAGVTPQISGGTAVLLENGYAKRRRVRVEKGVLG